jgi:hypothetical protein
VDGTKDLLAAPKGLWVWQQVVRPGKKLRARRQETFSLEEQVFAAEK